MNFLSRLIEGLKPEAKPEKPADVEMTTEQQEDGNESTLEGGQKKQEDDTPMHTENEEDVETIEKPGSFSVEPNDGVIYNHFFGEFVEETRFSGEDGKKYKKKSAEQFNQVIL